jgi:hypothetical protein
MLLGTVLYMLVKHCFSTTVDPEGSPIYYRFDSLNYFLIMFASLLLFIGVRPNLVVKLAIFNAIVLHYGQDANLSSENKLS